MFAAEPLSSCLVDSEGMWNSATTIETHEIYQDPPGSSGRNPSRRLHGAARTDARGDPDCDGPGGAAACSAMSLSEIEKAVEQLPPEDFARFTSWLSDLASERLDRQFEADVKSGKLDALGQRAMADYEAGRCTEL